jgi:uncharacterized membrane protein
VADKPFWMDEITTIRRSSLPFGALLKDSVFFHQLPAYFVITSWLLPFGTDESVVRLPAVFFGALSCGLAFGVARAVGGTAAGVAAGLLMALSPDMVQYGQEARSYTMLICGVLIALWGLLLLIRKPLAAGRPFSAPDASRGAWAAYTLGTILALNTLSAAMFWFLAANLAVACTIRERKFWRNWLTAQAAILLICLPWFIAMKFAGQRGALGGLDWVPPVDAARLWWTLSGTYLLYVTSLIKLRIFSPGVPGLGFLVLAMALAGAYRLRRRRGALTVLAAAILVLPLGLLAISLLATPVLMPRYVLWSAAPFFICAGLGILLLPKRWRWAAVGGLGILLAVNLAPYYQDETKPRWDVAGAMLYADFRPGDLLLVDDPQAVSLMNLYLGRQHLQIPPADWTTGLPRAVAWRAAGHRVWAVQGQVGQADHENFAQFLARIAPLGAPALDEPAGLDIRLLRFDPK